MQKFALADLSLGLKNLIGNREIHKILAGIVILAAVALLYFSTSLGEVLQQSDMRQGIANGQEAKEFFEQTGEKTCWTNSLFSGMPTFQIAPSYNSTKFVTALQSVYGLGLPSPVNLLFMMMAGFYILMLAFGTRWYLALLGAVAYGLSSYFIIIIGAGHIWKFCVLTYVPPTIAGIVLCYKGRLLAGGALTALFGMMQIASNHVQMTFYFLFVVVALMIAYLVESIRARHTRQWLKATGVLAVSALLAVGANLTSLYNTYEYSKETNRGRSTDLHSNDAPKAGSNINANGIDRSGVTSWSYGIDETLTLLIPDIKGGATVKPNDVDNSGGLAAASVADLPGVEDAISNAVISQNPEENAYLQQQLGDMVGQFRQYFGDQPMTNGPVYVGALILALAILGFVVVKGPLKWAMLAVTIWSILLAWGHNFSPLTYWMIDHFPMYDKFRAPASILVIAELTLPLMAIFAVAKLIDEKDLFNRHRKAVYASFGLPLFICLLAMIMPSAFGNGLSAAENGMLAEVATNTSGIEQSFYTTAFNIVKEARLGMVADDATRSFVILAIGLALIWLNFKGILKAKVFVAGIALVVVADLFSVDKRYLNADMFVEKPSGSEIITIEPTAADLTVLQDTAMNYRVIDVLNFGSPNPSYFHKSVGGYHAAKLTRYNDLIAKLINPVKTEMENSVRTRGEVFLPDSDKMKALNMLNTKYLIFGDSYVLENPGAMGNAWFVDHLSYADNANAEMDALKTTDITKAAVADKKFRTVLGESMPKAQGDTIYETGYKPNELCYRYHSANGGIAVFSEVYFPWGWKATVDGQELPIARANYVLRALRLPAGDHEVVFRFDPQSIHTTEAVAYTSLTIVYLAILMAILLSVIAYSKKRNEIKKEE